MATKRLGPHRVDAEMNAPRLPLDREPGNGVPVWCSMCGALLTKADRWGDLRACQCERCRTALQARVDALVEWTKPV